MLRGSHVDSIATSCTPECNGPCLWDVLSKSAFRNPALQVSWPAAPTSKG